MHRKAGRFTAVSWSGACASAHAICHSLLDKAVIREILSELTQKPKEMPTTPITASMLYDFVQCRHRVYMDVHGPQDLREEPNAFVELLWEQGVQHEAAIVSILPGVLNLRTIPPSEREAATRKAMADRVPLIYGGRLTHNGTIRMVGEPDLLRLRGCGYRAGDIKSGSGIDGDELAALKPSYALQVAHYTNILELEGLSDGSRDAFIIDGTGTEFTYPLADKRGPRNPQTWWDFYLECLQDVHARVSLQVNSIGAMSALCKICHWRPVCKAALVAADDLTQIAELGRAKRDTMATQLPTVAALAACNPDALVTGSKTVFEGIGPTTLRRLHERAVLLKTPNAQPYLREALTLPIMAKEVFFDIEADPMRDLVYLHGFVERAHGQPASARFTPVLAESATATAEEQAFGESWAYLCARVVDSVVYYYSKYERTAYKKLAGKYPAVCSVADVEALFALPNMIDLYFDVVKKATEWPTNDQSIKTIAVFLGFHWRDSNPSGAASIEWYARWVETGDPAIRQRILDYNEDDCLATGVVVDGVRQLQVRATA